MFTIKDLVAVCKMTHGVSTNTIVTVASLLAKLVDNKKVSVANEKENQRTGSNAPTDWLPHCESRYRGKKQACAHSKF